MNLKDVKYNYLYIVYKRNEETGKWIELERFSQYDISIEAKDSYWGTYAVWHATKENYKNKDECKVAAVRSARIVYISTNLMIPEDVEVEETSLNLSSDSISSKFIWRNGKWIEHEYRPNVYCEMKRNEGITSW